MLIVTLKLMLTRARGKASPLCLCLMLAGWLSAPPLDVFGGGAAGPATNQSAELQEAERLTQQTEKLYAEGRYAEAVPAAERALAIRERALGPLHPLVAYSLNNLARAHEAKGDYARAEPLYRRALETYEKVPGSESNVAAVLNNLGGLYAAKGDYARAEPLYQRAFAIHEKASGPDHPSVANVLNSLAALYAAKGDYARAEPLLQRALAAFEKALGPDHPNVAFLLNNLADVYRERGDYVRAEPLYQRSLSIREKALGPDHPNIAYSLNNLAVLYQSKRDFAKAEPLLQRSLAVLEKALGPGHPTVAAALSNLADLYRETGEYDKAVPLYQRSLAALEKAFGPGHPDVATPLSNLAVLYSEKGENELAEVYFQRVLAIREKALGHEHPLVALTLTNSAALYWAGGDYAQAVRLLTRAGEVRERNLSLILSTGSERQKLAYLATLSKEAFSAVSLHARSAPADPQALRLAVTTVLRRKGRALDAMSEQVSALRRRLNPQDRELLDQLSAAQSRLSALALGGPGKTPPQEHAAEVARLQAEVERLQDAVSRRSAEFRARTQPVTLEQVRQALPAGAALVEFFSYQPYDPKAQAREARFGPARYVAYVVGRAGEPAWADLGEAAAVEADASRLLGAMKCPQSAESSKCPPVAEVRQSARALDERVMRPVRRLLGGIKQVFLSPDGALNLVPFAALVDENDKYLVEGYSLTYLTSGRDLLRLQLTSESRQPPLVVADPLFGHAGAAGAVASRGAGDAGGRRSAEMGQVQFGQLPGTAEEAKALGAALPDVRVLTRDQATEEALKQVSAPRILHVATHGFFLPDQPRETAGDARGLKVAGGARGENPLLRSGLALAGANRQQIGGGEDGILTALEAAALDLWGTQLVVLSACETGVGKVETGEGVYGLRRALVLAGSESQVMSLWQVSDEATRDLMVGYYQRLQAGEGRTEALRHVQLEMLSGGRVSGGAQRGLSVQGLTTKADRSHPYFWAAFIQSGDWRPMGGPAVTPE